MTTFDDFDRRLSSFLDEGPVRAPERAADAAIAWCQAHPRRRDPLAALRRDPMSRPAMWSARPVLVFAVLGLLLAMSLAVVIGSQPRQPTVVPPDPSVPAESAPPASDRPAPSVPASPGEISVDIVDSNGVTKTVVITDESGLLENAFAWEADINREQRGEIEVNQLGADEGGGLNGIVVQWLDLSCPDDVLMTVDEAARNVTVEGASCGVDAIGVDHGVWLEFSEPVPAEEVTAEIVR
jgi:hypothetical protein